MTNAKGKILCPQTVLKLQIKLTQKGRKSLKSSLTEDCSTEKLFELKVFQICHFQNRPNKWAKQACSGNSVENDKFRALLWLQWSEKVISSLIQ